MVEALRIASRAGRQLTKARAGTLLSAALALRETARELVQKRKAGSVGDPAELNRVLALSSGYQQLNWKKGQAPKFEHHDRQKAAEALLVPVAQAVARLLSQGDFTLIRECEHPSCTLWFYDRTKSHQRRWCRMTACGNRAKVAAFRARRRK